MKTNQYIVQLNPKRLLAGQKNMITFHDEINRQPVDNPSRKYSCIEKDSDDFAFSVPYDETELLRIKPEVPPLLFFYHEAYFYSGQDYTDTHEDDDLVKKCKTTKSFSFKENQKLKNNQAKWTTTKKSFDRCMYCAPGLETNVLQVETQGEDAILRLYEVESLRSSDKPNVELGKKNSYDTFTTPKIGYSMEEPLNILSKAMGNYDMSEFKSYSQFRENKFYNKAFEDVENPPYPHLADDIDTYSSKESDGDFEKKFLFYDDECFFGKTINAPNTKQTFFIPWSSTYVMRITPRSKYHPIISNFDLNLPTSPKQELFYDAVFCQRNDSIYCIPFNADYILQIIPRKEKTYFRILKDIPITTNKERRFSSGVIGYDQNIYCIPFNEDIVLKIIIQNDDPFADPEYERLDLENAKLKGLEK